MTTAWRIVKKKHAALALDGEGARIFGGRWNLKGAPAVYAADSLALAALELFIHLGRPGFSLAFVYIQIEIPPSITVSRLEPADLPRDWRGQPPPVSTQTLGSEWLDSLAGAVLAVPSVMVPHGQNLLFNPRHADFGKLAVSPPRDFSFDPRMWK